MEKCRCLENINLSKQRLERWRRASHSISFQQIKEIGSDESCTQRAFRTPDVCDHFSIVTKQLVSQSVVFAVKFDTKEVLARDAFDSQGAKILSEATTYIEELCRWRSQTRYDGTVRRRVRERKYEEAELPDAWKWPHLPCVIALYGLARFHECLNWVPPAGGSSNSSQTR